MNFFTSIPHGDRRWTSRQTKDGVGTGPLPKTAFLTKKHYYLTIYLAVSYQNTSKYMQILATFWELFVSNGV